MEEKNESLIKAEFKISEFLTVKLEWDEKKGRDETFIYVSGERFRQCKYLFLNIPAVSSKKMVDSIDEAAEFYGDDLHDDGWEAPTPKDYGLIDNDVFWGHASNLQAWYEHDYDTRLLHSNLAFPLLKRLEEAGDPKARGKYKEELAKRYVTGNAKYREFLHEEGYMFAFDKEEIARIALPTEQYQALQRIHEKTGRLLTYLCDERNSIQGNVRYLKLYPFEAFPEELLVLKDALQWLQFEFKKDLPADKTIIPDWIGELTELEHLELRGNFTALPESIGELTNLKELDVVGKLTSLPESIGNLKNLEELRLRGNELKNLPDSLSKLQKLRILELDGNQFKTIPDAISSLQSLDMITLEYNPLKEIPRWLPELPSMSYISLNEEMKHLIKGMTPEHRQKFR
jgi:hypothetical protein